MKYINNKLCSYKRKKKKNQQALQIGTTNLLYKYNHENVIFHKEEISDSSQISIIIVHIQ